MLRYAELCTLSAERKVPSNDVTLQVWWIGVYVYQSIVALQSPETLLFVHEIFEFSLVFSRMVFRLRTCSL